MPVLIKRKKKPGPRPTIDWPTIKADYMQTNLQRNNGQVYTLGQCALRWGISYGQLRIIASQEKWVENMETQKTELISTSVALVKDEAKFNEYEVRSRQARYARIAQDKAIARLQLVNPEHLSIKEAAFLLRLGLTGELKALGLPEQINIAFSPFGSGSSGISKAKQELEEQLSKKGNVNKAIQEAYTILEGSFKRVG